MKLYRVSFKSDDEEVARWAGTQAGVVAIKKDWLANLKLKRKEISTEEIDVPTVKAELIEWLNTKQV